MSVWGPYPERTEEQERERRDAEDKKGEHEMEYEREMEATNEEWRLTEPQALRGLLYEAEWHWFKCSDNQAPWPDGAPQEKDAFVAWYIATAAQRKLVGWAEHEAARLVELSNLASLKAPGYAQSYANGVIALLRMLQPAKSALSPQSAGQEKGK